MRNPFEELNLSRCEEMFDEIMKSESDSHQRGIKLAMLMEDMESVWSIPIVSDRTAWLEKDEVNRKVLELYEKISDSRGLWR